MAFAQKTIAVSSEFSILLWPFIETIRSLCIQNQSADTIRINFATTPTTSFGFMIASGELFLPNIPPRAEIKAIGTINSTTFQTIFTYVDY